MNPDNTLLDPIPTTEIWVSPQTPSNSASGASRVPQDLQRGPQVRKIRQYCFASGGCWELWLGQPLNKSAENKMVRFCLPAHEDSADPFLTLKLTLKVLRGIFDENQQELKDRTTAVGTVVCM